LKDAELSSVLSTKLVRSKPRFRKIIDNTINILTWVGMLYFFALFISVMNVEIKKSINIKMEFEIINPDDIKTKLSDVKGIDEIKEEV